MSALSSELRRQLENVVIEARDVAETAARSALQKRAVDAAEPFPHFNAADKDQRNRLRARGRQVGDVRRVDKTQTIDQLVQELAYEFWHRMLFARFLAENHLLMHPDGVAVSLEECEELAPYAAPPAPNGFALAARYASTMLPQIFRTDDVLLEIEFAPEQRLALERLLAGLPRQTFLADDSLGWVYQFWQNKKKDEVNQAGEKIDGGTLPAVTQIFTEHYMVQFLLHNTIGAGWCARHNIKGPPGGAGVPAGQAPVEMEYLRWRDDGTPAAGTFDTWPKTLAEFSMLDPCCGSGHFLVSAFNLLVPLRMHDEKLATQEACEAVLRDNLFGLELDPRCTQIAAFALALAAWKYPDESGQPLAYRPLPPLNIACSGQGVACKKEEWLALANGDASLKFSMFRLYDLFLQAPELGSLLNPSEQGGRFKSNCQSIAPLMEIALRKQQAKGDAEAHAIGVAAFGIAKAADFLSKTYSLVATNVPFLARFKQGDALKSYLKTNYSDSKADLATAFFQRCLHLASTGGSVAIVSPQNWLFQGTFKKFRSRLLNDYEWALVATLGPSAFQDMNWWAANTQLTVVSKREPSTEQTIAGVDVSGPKQPSEKARLLQTAHILFVQQATQRANPDAIISFSLESGGACRLSDFADVVQGVGTTDLPRYVISFWELQRVSDSWVYYQVAPDASGPFTGLECLLRWEQGQGELATIGTARKGIKALNKQGFGVAVTNYLYAGRFLGTRFDCTLAVILPKQESDFHVIGHFVLSDDFKKAVRTVDQAISVTESSFGKVPFDHAKWKLVEQAHGPLPDPVSNDLVQWLFKGDIATSTDPLQVAVSRLLGYLWPEQPKEPDGVHALVEDDGIICLSSVRGEAPAAERLLEVLHAAYGEKWSDTMLHTLLTDAGCKVGASLDDWLRHQFFEQHCKRFQQRPFVWHITDGRHKDGFSALVNYHKLNHKTLENLTYSYLGDWITAQAADAKAGKTGADLRLKAAQDFQEKLKAILAGDPPYDVFVRWKPLHEQPIGWNPDLNDGVRVNIRPFVEAGILRKNPNIKWTKDRGKEPERDKDDYPWFSSGSSFTGDRVNDVHLTNAEKQAARYKMKAKEGQP
jgi:hypothetical protein